jgi:hypothetical protein
VLVIVDFVVNAVLVDNLTHCISMIQNSLDIDDYVSTSRTHETKVAVVKLHSLTHSLTQ